MLRTKQLLDAEKTRKGLAMTEGIKGDFQYQGPLLPLIERISDKMRRRMFDRFMLEFKPQSITSVVDIGVTSDSRIDSNFFEKLYPYSERVTAVGLEDASFLETQYPGLRFIKADGLELPFEDKSFDIAVSWAVIEHVGNRDNQRRFLKELCRVARRSCITTPNRWYPVEFHTVLPLLHWLPPELFRRALKMMGKDFFAREENLNLLGQKELLDLVNDDARCRIVQFYLFGMPSNLMLIIE
ncbi:MAG TPA: class I SAM-dependent methyltransferase [Candidatus Obscuribacterales bacterium]